MSVTAQSDEMPKSLTDWMRRKARDPDFRRRYRQQVRQLKPWKYLLESAKARAKQRGVDFALTEEWASANWTGRCAITDVEFDQSFGHTRLDMHPSIDRIDPELGYIESNCWFILSGVNRFKSAHSSGLLLSIAQGIIRTHNNGYLK